MPASREGCPAEMRYGCSWRARARVFDELCPRAPACDKLRCERLSGVGCALRLEAFESERSWGTAGAGLSGRGVSGVERLSSWSSESAVHGTTLLQLKQTKQHVVIYNMNAKQRFVGRRATTRASHLCCHHSAVRRCPRSARNNAVSATARNNAAQISNNARASRAPTPKTGRL